MRRVCLVALVLVSCATTDQPQKGATTVQDAASDYYPIQEGNAWAHDVVDHRLEGQGPVLVTSRITDVTADGFTVDSVRQRVRYQRLPDGVFKPESRYYLLKDPIVEGAAWPIPLGGSVRITSTGAEIEVPAGKLSNCIVVLEQLDGIHRVEWVYAKGIGPVRMRVYDLRTGTPELVIEGELRSWALAADQVDLVGSD